VRRDLQKWHFFWSDKSKYVLKKLAQGK